ncbi:hypothetical protein DFQ30_007988 [Apophysomyces sp. BC1015]|nr:hypothetical protein DFQ30_007988 [Apophysomyces sp. BC1015]
MTRRARTWKRTKSHPCNDGKMPLIVFGAGMFGNNCHYKGHRKAAVNKLWGSLKRREARGEVLVLKIDEYLTSQICNKCKARNLRKVVTPDRILHHGIQACKSCGMYWNRDINASKSMLYIAQSIWDGHGRLQEFRLL